MVVLAGEMNGLVGSSNVGYDGIHGSFGYGGMQMDPGSFSISHSQNLFKPFHFKGTS